MSCLTSARIKERRRLLAITRLRTWAVMRMKWLVSTLVDLMQMNDTYRSIHHLAS